MTATLPMRRVGLADVCHHAVFLHQEIYVRKTSWLSPEIFFWKLGKTHRLVEIVRWRINQGRSPRKNQRLEPWTWWLPIFSPLPSFPGKPCFVFAVVSLPRIFGKSLLGWNIARRLFSRWGLQILSRKARPTLKNDDWRCHFNCVSPPQKRLSEKNSEDFWRWDFFSGVESKSPFFWGFSQVTGIWWSLQVAFQDWRARRTGWGV